MHRHQHRKTPRRIAAAAAVGLGLGWAADLGAATFTYTRTTTGTDQWTAGTNWDAPPVSAADTTLSFGGALTGQRSVVANNDLAGNFTLNAMSLTFSQSAGNASTIVASGGTLEFVANDTVGPLLTFDTGTGAVKPNVTISSNILLSAGLGIVANSNATVSGLISGSNGLTLAAGSSGSILLSGLNSYTGPTVLNGGTLRASTLGLINADSSIGRGSVAGSAADLVFGGGTLQFVNTTAQTTDRLFTVGNASGNTATLDASGTARVIFSGTGNVALANAAPHTLTFAGSLATGNNLAQRNTFAPVINDYDASNKTGVVKTGVSMWEFSSANGYSGGTTVSGGVLEADALGGFGSGTITADGGTASLNAAGTWANAFNISGIGGIYNYSSIPVTAGAIRMTNGVEVTGLINLLGDSRISTSGGTNGGAAVTISSRITGAFSLQFGAGANASNAPIILANPLNDWTGSTTFANENRAYGGANSAAVATILLGANEVIPHGVGRGDVTMSMGDSASQTLNLNGFSETINGLNSAGAGRDIKRIITNGGTAASVLTFGDNNANGTFLGRFQDGSGGVAGGSKSLWLTKIGNGTQTLTGTATHTGDTSIVAGTLKLDFTAFATGNSSAPSNYFSPNSTIVLAGGTLAVQGRGDGAATSQSGTNTSGSYSVTLPSAAGLAVGQGVTGSGIAANAYIVVINGNVITISAATTAANTTVETSATTGSTSQSFKGLNLQDSSTLDFGAGDSTVLTFNDLARTPGEVLTITNWDGTALTGGGGERLMFANSVSFTFAQNEVQFAGYNPGYAVVSGASSYEIVPVSVPEPASLSLLAAAGLLRRRRRG